MNVVCWDIQEDILGFIDNKTARKLGNSSSYMKRMVNNNVVTTKDFTFHISYIDNNRQRVIPIEYGEKKVILGNIPENINYKLICNINYEKYNEVYKKWRHKWAHTKFYYSTTEKHGDTYGYIALPPHTENEINSCSKKNNIIFTDSLYKYLTIVSREMTSIPPYEIVLCNGRYMTDYFNDRTHTEFNHNVSQIYCKESGWMDDGLYDWDECKRLGMCDCNSYGIEISHREFKNIEKNMIEIDASTSSDYGDYHIYLGEGIHHGEIWLCQSEAAESYGIKWFEYHYKDLSEILCLNYNKYLKDECLDYP